MTLRILQAAAWTAICVAAAGAVWYGTTWGVGLSPDSAAYIAGARRLLSPLGVAPLMGTGRESSLSGLAPAYPAAIALASIVVQQDPLHAARWLAVLLFPVNLLIAGLLIRRALPGSPWTPVVGALVLLVAPDLIRVHVMAWSEPLFLLLVLVTMYLLDRALEEPRPSRFALVGLATAAACLTRQSGLALAAAVGLALLLWGPGTLRRRLMMGASLGVAGLVPVLAWSWIAGGYRQFAVHPPAFERWAQGWENLQRWIVPRRAWLPDPLRSATAILVFGAVVASVLGQRQPATGARSWSASSRLIGCLALFVVCHLVVLVAASTFWDATITLGRRLMAPAHAALVVIASVSAGRALAASARLQGTWGRAGAAVLLAAGATHIAIQAVETRVTLTLFHAEGQQYASPEWRGSELLAAIDALPRDTYVVTNGGDAVSVLTGRAAVRLPSRVDRSSGFQPPDYEDRMATLGERLRQRRGVVAYFRTLSQARWYVPGEDDVRGAWDLEVLFEGADGVLYRPRP